MGITMRAAWAVGLLAGFYLVAIALLVAVIGIDVAVAVYVPSAPALVLALSLTVAAFVVVPLAVFASTRTKAGTLAGISVSAEDEPMLWARARQLAAAAGTPAPDEIRIDHSANAAVAQDALLLGLVPGKRRVTIGAALLLALSAQQLDAVLAHEFGHYSNHDTRLLPIVNRGRMSVLTAVQAAAGRSRPGPSSAVGRMAAVGRYPIYRLFRAYAMLYLAATQAISRRQEFQADRISAQVAGAGATIAALQRIPEIQAAYSLYLDRFLAAGLRVGLVPEPCEIVGGFGAMLAQGGQQSADQPATRPRERGAANRFDSHPPIGDRIAALADVPVDGRAADGSGRAIEVLDRPDDMLTAVGQQALGERREQLRTVDWDTMADAIARQRARATAQPLIDALHLITGVEGTFSALLDLVDAGRLDEILHRLLTPAQARYAGTSATALELARKAMMTALPPWVLAELSEAGAVRWTHSWSTSARLSISPALRADLNHAYAALLAETADTTPLRNVLQQANT